MFRLTRHTPSICRDFLEINGSEVITNQTNTQTKYLPNRMVVLVLCDIIIFLGGKEEMGSDNAQRVYKSMWYAGLQIRWNWQDV